PDEGDVAAAIALAAPLADHLLVQVDHPVGVLVGGDVGEARVRLVGARLAALGPDEGDDAEVLAGRLGPLDGRDAGHVDATTPAALGEPGHLTGRASRLGDVRLAGLRKLVAQPRAPAPIGQALDAGVGDE